MSNATIEQMVQSFVDGLSDLPPEYRPTQQEWETAASLMRELLPELNADVQPVIDLFDSYAKGEVSC